MATKLYIGNLPRTATKEDVCNLLQQAGKVLNCDLVVDPSTNCSLGFAFVEMASRKAALDAIWQFDNAEVEESSLIVYEMPTEESFSEEYFPGRSSVWGGSSG